MNKKLTLIISAVALIGAITVGGTLAWFTSKGEVKNVVTMGDVKITLTEPEFSKNANNTIKNVMPGQVITKDPTVTNTSTANGAYIRAKINVDGTSLTDAQKATIASQLVYNIDATKWKKGDGDYYYYVDSSTKGVLAAGQKVQLFTTVTVPGADWKNEYANLAFNVNVVAEAVQTDNFTAFKPADANPTWGGTTVE